MGVLDFLRDGNLSGEIDASNIQINIIDENDVFQNERQKIIESALKLIQLGQYNNIEDAIICAATYDRGFRFSDTYINDKGKRVLVFRETISPNKEEIIEEK
jgi:hypothetical protein